MAESSMTSSKNNGRVTSAQLRMQIEQTKNEMDRTLSEIQQKFDQNPIIHLLTHKKIVAVITGATLILSIVGLKIYLHHRR
ncbi:MAG: DUF3618 domain-containing protein [Chitinivibrionales bacterium]